MRFLVPAGIGVLGLVLLTQFWPERGLQAETETAVTIAATKPAHDPAAEKEFKDEIEPILSAYCYDCHGDGATKGEISLDEYENVAAHLQDHDLWLRAWQNIRTQMMPPSKKDQPDAEERETVLRWIEKTVFKLDPANPDPGRVTIRRLNREEYRNTIRDLLDLNFDVDENFPPDDTGYGFDTIGDVLSISPLLMEKYLSAAEEIAALALPRDAGKPTPIRIDAGNFREPGNNQQSANFMEAEIEHTVRAEREFSGGGKYRLAITYVVEGQGRAKGHTANWTIKLDGKDLETREIRWDKRGTQKFEKDIELSKGKHRFDLHIKPGEPSENPNDKMGVRVAEYELRPLDGESWERFPESYKRIFFKGLPSKDEKEQAAYAREILERFASRAFRRPASKSFVDRLTALSLEKSREPGMKFVDGIEFGVAVLLTSPRFLFRGEAQAEPDNPGKVVPIDEYSLASRLSYFLWSSTPDEELLRLAKEGKLRANLRSQIDRMLGDEKSGRLVRNFVGQWLQARDLEGINLDTRRILRIRDRREANRVFSNSMRGDMRQETEMFFDHVLKENLPALELLTADYSFLNERLARFYGVRDVRGNEFRKVSFGKDQEARGGILAQGTFLIVTSNPSRTSPVKRGLFVLDNILGTPAPPAPPNVPELEEARKEAKDGEPTMREMMVLHREKPLCKSCHARMDPIGLALENFNALGQWRDEEGGKPIDTAGKLITGEEFGNVMELKKILASSRKQDFYRCLTEKMLTYGLGRGVEYYDAPTVDKIVNRLEKKGGAMRELIYGVVESAPFQMRRGDGNPLEVK